MGMRKITYGSYAGFIFCQFQAQQNKWVSCLSTWSLVRVRRLFTPQRRLSVDSLNGKADAEKAASA